MTVNSSSGFCRVTILWNMPNGDVANNVNHFEFTGLPGPDYSDDLLVLVGAWLADVKVDLAAPLSDLMSLAGADVYVWDAVTEEFDTVGVVVDSQVGNSVAGIQSTNVAGLVTWIVDNLKRNGSNYIAGMSTSQYTTGGEFTPLGLANILAWGMAFFNGYTAVSGATLVHHVFSRSLADFLLTKGISGNVVPASQRRRLRGRGS